MRNAAISKIRTQLRKTTIDLPGHMVFYPSGEVVEFVSEGDRPLGIWNGAAPRGPIFEFLAKTAKKRPFVLFQCDFDCVVAPPSGTLRSAASVIRALRDKYGEDVYVLAPSAWRGIPPSPITRLIPQYDRMFAERFPCESLHSVPWEKKRSHVMWRGRAHDVAMRDRIHFPFLLRYSTIGALKGYGPADVGFTHTSSFPHLQKPFLKPEDMCGAKVLLCIDGWGWPGSLAWSLASKCVVLLVSVHATWISPRLRPWHHYVPVDVDVKQCWPGYLPFSGGPKIRDLETATFDMTDVFAKLQWIWNHDDEAKQIAERAYAFYTEHMNPAAQREYLREVLSE